MQFSIIISAFAAATTVSAWSVEISQGDANSITEACGLLDSSLVSRDCNYDSCEDCYDTNGACRDCNEGSGSLGSCLAW